MSTSDDQIHVIPVEEAAPGTMEMVGALQQIMHSVAQSLPMEFHPTDLISAHLRAAFDLSVLNAHMSPQETRDNLVKGLDALLGDALESKRRSN